MTIKNNHDQFTHGDVVATFIPTTTGQETTPFIVIHKDGVHLHLIEAMLSSEGIYVPRPDYVNCPPFRTKRSVYPLRRKDENVRILNIELTELRRKEFNQLELGNKCDIVILDNNIKFDIRTPEGRSDLAMVILYG